MRCRRTRCSLRTAVSLASPVSAVLTERPTADASGELAGRATYLRGQLGPGAAAAGIGAMMAEGDTDGRHRSTTVIEDRMGDRGEVIGDEPVLYGPPSSAFHTQQVPQGRRCAWPAVGTRHERRRGREECADV